MKTIVRFAIGAPLALLSIIAWAGDRYQPIIPKATADRVKQAQALRLAGQPQKALEILKPIVAANPDYFLARYNLGLTFIAVDQPKDGIAQLETAQRINVSQNLGEPTIYNSLGWAYLRQGNYKAASVEFKSAQTPQVFQQLSPEGQRKVLNNAGLTASFSGQADTAVLLYKQAVKVPVPATAVAK